MDKTTARAQEMYDEFRIGHYSYGQKRTLSDAFLLKFVSTVGDTATLYDIGCGSGFWLDSYVACGIPQHHLYGVDLSPKNIEEIKARGFQASCDNLLSLKLDDGISDHTICNGVLHHTSDPRQAFAELIRITKPGGSIYLAVYNAWNPYYYLVHKATYPLRYWYWNRNKKILDRVVPLARWIMQPFAWLFFRELLSHQTVKTIFMDQVMTPRADLFTKGTLRHWSAQHHCEVLESRFIKHFLMVAAIIRTHD
jgi:SAM-dependent methyltransferase